MLMIPVVMIAYFMFIVPQDNNQRLTTFTTPKDKCVKQVEQKNIVDKSSSKETEVSDFKIDPEDGLSDEELMWIYYYYYQHFIAPNYFLS